MKCHCIPQYNNEVFTANHIEDGLYTLDIPEITTDKQYQLIVDVDGVSYTAKEELALSGTFDSAYKEMVNCLVAMRQKY